MTRGMFAHTHFLIVPLSQMRLRGAGGVFKLTQKSLYFTRGGCAQMITVLHGVGGSVGTPKGLCNLCTTSNDNHISLNTHCFLNFKVRQ